jgi:hypothetical protein
MLSGLPLMADIMLGQRLRRPSGDMPLTFVYCFPLESIRNEFLSILRRVAQAIERCELLETALGMVIRTCLMNCVTIAMQTFGT